MHSDCPSNELLAAFIDARLDPRTRARVADHIASCSDCYAFVADVSAAVEAIGAADFEPEGFGSPQPERGKVLPFRALAAAAALAAGLAAVYFVPALREMVPGLRSPGIGELAEVAPDRRTSVGRLAEVSTWRERPQVMRSGNPDSDDSGTDQVANARRAREYELTTLHAEIAEVAAKHPTARNLRNLGIAALLEKEPDDAIVAFNRAAALAPADAALLNDRAAAYLARANLATGSNADAAKALADAERAWQLDPTPAAAWNRAAALQKLQRDVDARKAWAEYLRIEKDPKWRAEATEQLQTLDELSGLR